jgi:hypothetical protein
VVELPPLVVDLLKTPLVEAAAAADTIAAAPLAVTAIVVAPEDPTVANAVLLTMAAANAVLLDTAVNARARLARQRPIVVGAMLTAAEAAAMVVAAAAEVDTVAIPPESTNAVSTAT